MTNTEQITAETITAVQIRTLRDEATAAGDSEQVALCNVALDHAGSDGARLARSVAREACADAINAARAMGDA